MADTTPITTSFKDPDPNYQPSTFAQAVIALRGLVYSILPVAFRPYIVSSTTPAVEDQDKLWAKQDGAGRFLGIYKYYNGHWVLPVPSAGARIGYFAGDPAVFFDGTGLGLVDTDYFGWAINNGLNGTANLSNRFIIGAAMDNVGDSGWSGSHWQTNASGAPLQSGGVASITLSNANTYRPATTLVGVDKYTSGGESRSPAGQLYGIPADPAAPDISIVLTNAGQPTPPAIPTLPPYFALCIISWVGY